MIRDESQVKPVVSNRLGYVLLRFGTTRLLIPQKDVRVIDLTMDMDRAAPPPLGVGWTRFRQSLHPVYCLSPELHFLSEAQQEERPICAVLEASERTFGLLCTETALLKVHEVILHDIPPAMAVPQSPFERLAMHATGLACVSSASRMWSHLLLNGVPDEQRVPEAS